MKCSVIVGKVDLHRVSGEEEGHAAKQNSDRQSRRSQSSFRSLEAELQRQGVDT
jgi:hypothetical protein